jgi:hypothetical protein
VKILFVRVRKDVNAVAFTFLLRPRSFDQAHAFCIDYLAAGTIIKSAAADTPLSKMLTRAHLLNFIVHIALTIATRVVQALPVSRRTRWNLGCGMRLSSNESKHAVVVVVVVESYLPPANVD